ncbi:RNA-binding S4 domain-containing protein [Corynebacterium choanae]|uniref:Heat shock protein 15 n=1 Tax=Corynebacterium choanae TaxID=1862358 RepID=A0A3G6J5E9_9CORY|nr:RNA-binding S4 domain-containing protein [Corynebacterium choanae]AZA12983.1 Heat shock protein 15 [Corynebacterium choanae]
MTDPTTTPPVPAKPARIDQWVWAVRLVKTRSAASDACKAGHIKLNGKPVKPSQQVKAGDQVRVWVHHREHHVEVVHPILKRVGAPVARTCYIDHTPPPPPREVFASLPQRDRGSGRPTKKQRRETDRLLGRRG